MNKDTLEKLWNLRAALAEMQEALDAELFGEPLPADDPDQMELELDDEVLPF